MPFATLTMIMSATPSVLADVLKHIFFTRYCDKKRTLALQRSFPGTLCSSWYWKGLFEQFSVEEKVRIKQCLPACISPAVPGGGFNKISWWLAHRHIITFLMGKFREIGSVVYHYQGHSMPKFTTRTSAHVECVTDSWDICPVSSLHGSHDIQRHPEHPTSCRPQVWNQQNSQMTCWRTSWTTSA